MQGFWCKGWCLDISISAPRPFNITVWVLTSNHSAAHTMSGCLGKTGGIDAICICLQGSEGVVQQSVKPVVHMVLL